MDNIYDINKIEIKKALKEIWNYMKLNHPIEKCDIIIGCGCSNLDIPIKCLELQKEGYAPKILFVGGYGKITKNNFNKPEAEIYKDIALANGIKEDNILIESKSTNTGDNFRFGMKILEKNNIKYNKILIVHKPFNERRTYSSAKIILKNKDIKITSPDITFEEYLKKLNKKSYLEILDEISVIVGDIQRMVIYPQFGWQIENELPELVKKSYYYLKDIGFSKYILSKEQIKDLIDEFGVVEGKKENYFS